MLGTEFQIRNRNCKKSRIRIFFLKIDRNIFLKTRYPNPALFITRLSGFGLKIQYISNRTEKYVLRLWRIRIFSQIGSGSVKIYIDPKLWLGNKNIEIPSYICMALTLYLWPITPMQIMKHINVTVGIWPLKIKFSFIETSLLGIIT